MTDRTPIYIEVDGLDRPTGLAEFTTGDVLPAANGGTGATSISAATGLVFDSAEGTLTTSDDVETVTIMGGSEILLARKIHVANDLSGSTSCAVIFDGAFSATDGLSALNISATNLEAATCPIPAPFAYIQLTSDDVASSDEKHVGYSNTPTSVVSNTDDISWDDSAKNFVVKKVGTYECVGRLFFEGGSTLIELHVNVEGSPVNTANPRAHTTVDPVERTISAIFTCAVDDVVDITYEATSAQTTAAQIGTTVTIKRLK